MHCNDVNLGEVAEHPRPHDFTLKLKSKLQLHETTRVGILFELVLQAQEMKELDISARLVELISAGALETPSPAHFCSSQRSLKG